MKKELLKHLLTSVGAVAGLAVLFVMSQSVIAQDNYNEAGDLLSASQEGGVQHLQLTDYQLGGYNFDSSNSLFSTGSGNFHLYGSAVLNDTGVSEDFIVDSGPFKSLNVGYDSFSVPELARLQVGGGSNATVRITDLGSSTDTNTYCVCADQYGAFRRCGIYNPANGQTCGQ